MEEKKSKIGLQLLEEYGIPPDVIKLIAGYDPKLWLREYLRDRIRPESFATILDYLRYFIIQKDYSSVDTMLSQLPEFTELKDKEEKFRIFLVTRFNDIIKSDDWLTLFVLLKYYGDVMSPEGNITTFLDEYILSILWFEIGRYKSRRILTQLISLIDVGDIKIKGSDISPFNVILREGLRVNNREFTEKIIPHIRRFVLEDIGDEAMPYNIREDDPEKENVVYERFAFRDFPKEQFTPEEFYTTLLQAAIANHNIRILNAVMLLPEGREFFRPSMLTVSFIPEGEYFEDPLIEFLINHHYLTANQTLLQAGLRGDLEAVRWITETLGATNQRSVLDQIRYLSTPLALEYPEAFARVRNYLSEHLHEEP